MAPCTHRKAAAARVRRPCPPGFTGPSLGTYLDVWDVFKQLVGDVFAALLERFGGHLVVRIPVPVSRVCVGGTRRGVVDTCGGDDAHGFACSRRKRRVNHGRGESRVSWGIEGQPGFLPGVDRV